MSASSSGRTAALVAAQAEAHDASVVGATDDALTVELRLRRASGRRKTYWLTIDTRSLEPRVREAEPEHLPRFCPNRHLSDDGWFCLNYSEEDPHPVHDAESATAFWGRLLKYLALQETTTVLRRWPSTHDWAHGLAAGAQARAERAAAALGSAFSVALDRRRLKAVHQKGSPFIQLLDGQRRLYSLWVEPRRVATLRQLCPCESGRTLACCGDHADQASALTLALMDWERQEQRFWEYAKDRPCCGQLDVCPLKPSETQYPTDELAEAA